MLYAYFIFLFATMFQSERPVTSNTLCRIQATALLIQLQLYNSWADLTPL